MYHFIEYKFARCKNDVDLTKLTLYLTKLTLEDLNLQNLVKRKVDLSRSN